MAVEVDGVRKAVNISWDKDLVVGAAARIFCKDVATGHVSNTNWSKNDGFGVITYPFDYEGTTEVTVEGDGGGGDTGFIEVTRLGAETGDGTPDPIEPPDPPLTIWGPGDPYPDAGLPGFQPYPDNSLPGNQPYPDQGLPGDQPEVDAGFPEDQPVVDPRK